MTLTELRTLLVKHLPSELSYESRQELLKLYGAVRVRCLADNGKMRYSAFALFSTHEEAKWALSKLHQLEILNTRLVAEFAKKQYETEFPKESDYEGIKRQQPEEEPSKKLTGKENLRQDMEKFSRNLHGIAPTLGLDYLPSPILKYKYPSPTQTIITNIAHALVAVPKFYTQVLHLMNKMNLPAPFGPPTPAPPLAPEPFVKQNEDNVQYVNNAPKEEDNIETQDMEVTSSEEESELESDGEDAKTDLVIPAKRPIQKQRKKQKKPKLQLLLPVKPTTNTSKTEPAEVFESAVQMDSHKKIQFNIKNNLETKRKEDPKSAEESEQGGFGVIKALKASAHGDNSNSESDEEKWDASKFISLSELRRKRVSHREMKTLSVFKNYSPGEPTVRVYIKNLARQVEEKDLRYIFGRFINRESETDMNMFDIRLMKEGRMKGQAFVTLADEKQAIEAVKETNGYILHTKPLVVQFARSAKPKETPAKEQTKKT